MNKVLQDINKDFFFLKSMQNKTFIKIISFRCILAYFHINWGIKELSKKFESFPKNSRELATILIARKGGGMTVCVFIQWWLLIK